MYLVMSLAHAAVCAQARAMAVKQVLVGFYDIPKSVEQPLQLVINPEVHILKRMFNCLKPSQLQCGHFAITTTCMATMLIEQGRLRDVEAMLYLSLLEAQDAYGPAYACTTSRTVSGAGVCCATFGLDI